MEIIPAIDLMGGRCVRLSQGDYDRCSVYTEDPVGMAHRFEKAVSRGYLLIWTVPGRERSLTSIY